MTTDVLDELEWRGLIAQSTDRDELRKALADAPLTLYAGFDPTAPSLHAGNLVPLLTLRRFQLAGHRPIALAGGATGLIGDPSGRSDERSLNTADTVADWADRVGGQLARFLDFTPGPTAATLVDNLTWTAPLSAIDFLRDIGKHFSVNAMLAKDSVSSRLEGGISFAEFSYMVLQSNDYLELFRREGCRLQIGGSDQWGNITAGLDLIRRVAGGAGHGLTVPLVTSASGEKFGKSTGGGRLWLDPELTSPYAFYQYWINVDDRDVVPYLRYFTFRSREETDELAAAAADRPQARDAQRALAADLTSLVHGADETARVEDASRALFGRGSLAELDVATLAAALVEASLVTVAGPELPPVADLMVLTGLCATRSEARRAIDQGGAYLNNRKVTDSNEAPATEDLLDGRYVVVRKGRRNVAGVERVL